MVGVSQWLAVLPLMLLGLLYWVRDRLRFNRADRVVSRVQWYSLSLNMLWVFARWSQNIHVYQGDVVSAMLTAPLGFTLLYVSQLIVLNDTVYLTQQQMYSFFLGLFMEYLWTGFSVMMYL